ncbi:MAG TPA: SCO family protein [Gammaproteobacteria bacterium]|nr:SCO family protein [Gammaproteobacteria bacterium]
MSEKTPRPYGTLLIFLFWVLLMAAVFFWMLPGKVNPPELQGVLRPEPRPLHAFELTDQHRQPFNLERLKNKWSFVFFGYTYCPDICPTTLSTLTGVVKQLQTDPQGLSNIQVVFVSVDPRRDTPEVLESYLKYFNPAFLGITGAQQAIDSLTRQFGAGYMLEPETPSGEYLVNHTSSIFLVDPHGQLLASFSPPHDPDTIVEQFRQIRALF